MPAIYDLANRGLLPPGLLARRLRPPGLGGPGLHAGRARRREGALADAVPRRRVGARWPRDSASSPATSTTTTRSTSCGRPSRTWTETSGTGGNHAFYLSIPPKFFPDVLRAAQGPTACADGPEHAWRRVVIEKPFGHDLASGAGAERRRRRGLPLRGRSSGSTTTWARRRCRTSWRCASPTRCSSRSGTPTTSTTCRSPWPRTSASAAAPATTTASVPPATSSRTTCCSCSPSPPWRSRSRSTADAVADREGEGALRGPAPRRPGRPHGPRAVRRRLAGRRAGRRATSQEDGISRSR